MQACLLATGSRPVRPAIPGAEDPSVLVLRRLADSLAIRERVPPAGRVAVIGSGFVGCEVAASLAARGAQVTMLSQEESPLLGRLGQAAGERIRVWLEREGVDFRGAVEVSAINGGRVLAPGQCDLVADLVILGVGVRPR
ncbi:FAD-dependent oxidoreductase, partial [Acinetobacter baumannii]|uniref:FAD-dependent oxidoreductase n=1 Tax=Acinetobacter baumannii TaxID=470 RepID=UPI0034D46F60